jgi:hypothetical protein
MSISLKIQAYSNKNNPLFQKHLKAVRFCIENELSFPKETSAFFKGKVGGDDLEDINVKEILKYIENGIEVALPIKGGLVDGYYRRSIKVADIPKEVDEIVIWAD